MVSSTIGLISLSSRFLKPSSSTARALASIYHIRFSSSSSSSPSSSSSSSASPAPAFSYQLSAAFSAKDVPFHPIQHSYHHTHHTSTPSLDYEVTDPLARRLNRYKSGEDAFFVSTIGSEDNNRRQPEPSSVSFGVADGVGGWSTSNIDPSHFSHGLCEHAINHASSSQHDANPTALTPYTLMKSAFKDVLADTNIEAGSSTACFGTASPAGELTIGNLGDSGYAHFTRFKLSHASSQQNSSFNAPYQLAKYSRRIIEQERLFGASRLCNYPEEMDIHSHAVAHGDVFMLATDGVWDNLYPQDLLQIISLVMTEEGAWLKSDADKTVQIGNLLKKGSSEDHVNGSRNGGDLPLSSKLASKIVQSTKYASYDTKRISPWARKYIGQRKYPNPRFGRQYDFLAHGGKVDDICVLVGLVMQH